MKKKIDRHNSVILFVKSYLTMIIKLILIFSHIITISSESISSQTWPNIIQDLSSKINNYKSHDKTMENHPLNEGFMLLSNNHKQSSSTISSSTSLIVINQISTSDKISSITCKTKTIVENLNHTISSIIDYTVDHLGKRVSNESIYDNDEIDSFLKVDDDILSKQIVNSGSTVDGSGYTTEETTEQTSESTTKSSEPITSPSVTTGIITSTTTSTTTTTIPFEPPTLPNNTMFIMKINCTNANNTLFDILTRINATLSHYTYSVSPNYNELECNDSTADVTLNFNIPDNITISNDLYELLDNIALSIPVPLVALNPCGNNETVPVINVTSCFLINLCHLCGIPPRGVCLPENGLSKCECFVNENDTSRPYIGDRCLPPPDLITTTTTTPPSSPSRWTPIIIGIVTGLASLFLATTCCLWALAAWRRRRHHKDDLRIFRLWHLPRAKVPTSATQNNVQNPLYNNTTPTDASSSNPSESDDNQSNITDSTFFKELDQKMGENLRATIARPNTNAILSSLPPDTISTISSNDPIDELDAIIDNDDLNLTFHDSLDDLYEDNEILEAVNPNVKLPRPNIDSKPSGFFSFFN
ncbi:unnamed protein product [Rotaria sordida]|uniref:Uncharacterized protein n=2 Tax=Rotaria sordida TaxID=392033 RepID=A0A818HAB4_9BILA|nr:unnamed protein product [Rotaria sordida]